MVSLLRRLSKSLTAVFSPLQTRQLLGLAGALLLGFGALVYGTAATGEPRAGSFSPPPGPAPSHLFSSVGKDRLTILQEESYRLVGGQEGWLLGRSEDNQQLWWHLWDLGNTGVPGHWLPSSWGLLLGAGGSAALLSFWALLSATRPVEAVFSFLGLLLSLLVPFFALEADYVAVIHLMVYSGAILIFFSFATLTTDQRGHWDQWYGGSVAPRAGLTGQGSSKLGADLLPLLVAGPLLLLWWQQLKHRLHGSVATRSFEYSSDDFLYGALPRELTLSSDLMTLGLEIFQRRLLSLTLLGLLLLLAFLTALELLAPRRQRRRSSSFFPKLGMVGAALVYMANPFEGWDPERLEALESSWSNASGDGWLLVVLPLLALGLGALAQRRYAFLHSFMVLEALALLLNLFLVINAVNADDLGGMVLVLFAVAVAAAETAVGLALFLALQSSAPETPAAPNRTALLPRGSSGRRRLKQRYGLERWKLREASCQKQDAAWEVSGSPLKALFSRRRK